MTNEQFINKVKGIDDPSSVEVFYLAFSPSYEYLAYPLTEIVVKRGGNIVLKCGPAFDTLNNMGNLSHRNANMPLYDALDSLCELKADAQIILERENCKDLWENVTAGKVNPKYVATQLFYDAMNDRLFISGPEFMPNMLLHGMLA